MVKGCKYIREEMNTSIAPGLCLAQECRILGSESHRKGKDYTYLYGNHVEIGSLTPYIDSAFDPRVDR